VWSGHAASSGGAASAAADERGQDGDGDPGNDPAMVANANLTESLRACSQRLARAVDDESRAEQELEAERAAEVDASLSLRARRRARREPSPTDWKQLASVGTVRYFLPCASFNPTAEVLDALGLAAGDVPVVQSAFSGARDAAWARIRPLCATAVGSAATADQLGLDSCPQVILDAQKATAPAAADSAMRAVGAVRAGLADPSGIPPEDAVGTTFLVLTGVARDTEGRLASALGPDEARAVVYGNTGCGRTAQFESSTGSASPTR
jgi:hypothetical protein